MRHYMYTQFESLYTNFRLNVNILKLLNVNAVSYTHLTLPTILRV